MGGKRPGPCPDAATSAKIVRLAGKLRRVASRRCGGLDGNCGIGGDDDDLTAIGWNAGSWPNLEDGACNGAIASCNDVVDCLSCVGEAAVDRAVDPAYDDLAPSVPGTKLNRCQGEIGKSVGRYLQAKTLGLAKCEAKVLAGALAGPCPDAAKTQPKLVRAAGKVGSAIYRACGGADRACSGADDFSPAAIGFPATAPGSPCRAGARVGGRSRVCRISPTASSASSTSKPAVSTRSQCRASRPIPASAAWPRSRRRPRRRRRWRPRRARRPLPRIAATA